jgi:hypothetical protein
MGRNYLKGRGGDRINAVLAAAGLQLQSAPPVARAALAGPLRRCSPPCAAPNRLKNVPERFFTDDEIAEPLGWTLLPAAHAPQSVLENSPMSFVTPRRADGVTPVKGIGQ